MGITGAKAMTSPTDPAVQAREVADGIMLDIFGSGWDNTPRYFQARNRILVALTAYGDARYREGEAENERLRAALLRCGEHAHNNDMGRYALEIAIAAELDAALYGKGES
jgi:hypothetical protein